MGLGSYCPRLEVPPAFTAVRGFDKSRRKIRQPTSSLSPIQRRQPLGILREKELQVIFDAFAADELMAGKKDRLDASIQKALGHFASKHVQDHRAPQGAERAGSLPASGKFHKAISLGSAVVEDDVGHVQ